MVPVGFFFFYTQNGFTADKHSAWLFEKFCASQKGQHTFGGGFISPHSTVEDNSHGKVDGQADIGC